MSRLEINNARKLFAHREDVVNFWVSFSRKKKSNTETPASEKLASIEVRPASFPLSRASKGFFFFFYTSCNKLIARSYHFGVLPATPQLEAPLQDVDRQIIAQHDFWQV